MSALAVIGKPAPSGGTKNAIVLHTDQQRPGHTGDPVKDLEAKLKYINEVVPTRIQNVSGSTAGAGSGDFHQYRTARRNEQFRLERMDREAEEEEKQRVYEEKQRQRGEKCEERSAKKRQKRLKKKANRRAAKGGAAGPAPPAADDSDSDDALAGKADLD